MSSYASSGSGSGSGWTHSSLRAGAGGDRLFFDVGSSLASSRSGVSRASYGAGSSQLSSISGSSRSSVSTNPSRIFSNSNSARSSASTNSSHTSGSWVPSQVSYGSSSSGRSTNSGSIPSTAIGLEPHIDAKKHANRQHTKLGSSGERLREDPWVKAKADRESNRMEREARAERKVESELRNRQGFYIEDRRA
ncbi:hypothetical protein EAE96_010287 [Botrytis aclada]|nr:hypothetical protein EAE96_010287 [Botrytis aclada]